MGAGTPPERVGGHKGNPRGTKRDKRRFRGVSFECSEVKLAPKIGFRRFQHLFSRVLSRDFRLRSQKLAKKRRERKKKTMKNERRRTRRTLSSVNPKETEDEETKQKKQQKKRKNNKNEKIRIKI